MPFYVLPSPIFCKTFRVLIKSISGSLAKKRVCQNSFILFLECALLRVPSHVLYKFQGLDLIDLRLFGKNESVPKFLHPFPFFSSPESEFYGVDSKKGPVAGLLAYPPSLLYWPGHKSDSCGHRTRSLRPLKMTPDGNWSLFRLTFRGIRGYKLLLWEAKTKTTRNYP